MSLILNILCFLGGAVSGVCFLSLFIVFSDRKADEKDGNKKAHKNERSFSYVKEKNNTLR